MLGNMSSEARDESALAKPARLVSLDAYRGFVMLAMVSAGLGFRQVAEEFPESRFWEFLGYQFSHVKWVGCTFWDLILPSFTLMVGVSMAFSYARRKAEGHSYGKMFLHALWRSLVLILLGILLASNRRTQTNFDFLGVLQRIGLGYPFLFLFWGRRWWIQTAGIVGILLGYWLLFALYPLPGPDFDYASVGVTADWENFNGLAAHWNKNTNPGHAYDVWLLNLFPRDNPFEYQPQGYSSLNFVSAIAIMIFGLMAGELLRNQHKSPSEKLRRLVLAGVACLTLAVILDHTIWPNWFVTAIGSTPGQWSQATGNPWDTPFLDPTWTVCPIIKRICTPTWVIFSTGWTLLILAGFYWVIDIKGRKRWAFPLAIVGMNSIAVYVISSLMRPWIVQTLKTHISPSLFDGTYGPIVAQVSVLIVLWLLCLWMYRQKIFIRI